MGYGDRLAGGAHSASFGPISVSDEKWKAAFEDSKLPSAADLDAVAEEEKIRKETKRVRKHRKVSR